MLRPGDGYGYMLCFGIRSLSRAKIRLGIRVWGSGFPGTSPLKPAWHHAESVVIFFRDVVVLKKKKSKNSNRTMRMMRV